MKDLDKFERAVLEKLFAGDHAVLAVLREQAQEARIASRKYTGAGFFLAFEVPPNAPVFSTQEFHFGDVSAVIDGLRYGAGFVVFVRDGRLDTLEGYSYEEPWPNKIRDFELSYRREPRDLSFPIIIV